MAQVNVTIDGKVAHVEQGSTILQAAQSVDIKIPTLCYLNLHDTNMENNNSFHIKSFQATLNN